MQKKVYASSAIILATRDYSESDRIISVFCKKMGKKYLIAKGARKIKSRKRGSLEVFNHIRYQATDTKGIGYLSEVEILDNFKIIREDLNKVALAYYFIETIGKISQEEENQDLYNLLLNYLKKLQEERKLKILRLKFIFDLLVLLGFWPLGKSMDNPDQALENVLGSAIKSKRVGKKLIS